MWFGAIERMSGTANRDGSAAGRNGAAARRAQDDDERERQTVGGRP
jgi:hypothetical protein